MLGRGEPPPTMREVLWQTGSNSVTAYKSRCWDIKEHIFLVQNSLLYDIGEQLGRIP